MSYQNCKSCNKRRSYEEYICKNCENENKVKVSFDFDGTLSRKDVQQYALSLIDKGFDVWVCTSRYNEDNKHKYILNPTNEDMYLVTEILKIPKEKIIFTNLKLKSKTLCKLDFIWHLDDDFNEINHINSETKTKGICVFGSSTWQRKCEQLITKQIDLEVSIEEIENENNN